MLGSVPKILCSLLFLSLCCFLSAAQGQRDTSVIIDRYFYIQDGDTMRVDRAYVPGDAPASVSYESDKALYDSLKNSPSGIIILEDDSISERNGVVANEAAAASGEDASVVILIVAVVVVAVGLAVLALFFRHRAALRKKTAASVPAFDSDSVRSISDLVSLLMRLASEKDISDGISKDSIRQLRGFVSDKNSLLSAMLASYSVTHPEFVGRLRSYGLTDQEIGYCCLYAAGLNGKDITFILNDGGHGHYNTASALRSRFGLKDRSVNLSQWLKSLLAETENVKS